MPDLKAMDIGEILDGAITIFRRHFLLFVTLGVAALWLPVALTIYMQLAGGRDQHIVLTLVTAAIQYFAGLFLTATAIQVISDSYLGRVTRVGDALALGASKIWPLFLVGLGKGIIIALIVGLVGVLAVLVGPILARAGAIAALVIVVLMFVAGWFAVFVACGYAVTTPIVVLENLAGAFDAFGRSWDLTRGFKRKVFVTAVVVYLIVLVPTMVLAGLGAYLLAQQSMFWGMLIEIVSATLPIVLTPILSCVFTLIYYDLRVRREAFDLQLLSQELGIR